MSKKMRLDLLGSRMKMYEQQETALKFIPNLPIYIRLDGRGFSKFTKKMKRPYDERLSTLLQEATKYLVKHTGASIGYCQSDEISLVIPNDVGSYAIFEGKKQKIVSTTVSLLTSYFVANFSKYFDEDITNFGSLLPSFDCRAFVLPSYGEASNAILWRYLDAIKNSKQMLGQHYFSHASLQNLSGAKIVDKLLVEKNISWDSYPPFFKEGVFFKRVKTEEGRSSVEAIVKPRFREILYEERVLLVTPLPKEE